MRCARLIRFNTDRLASKPLDRMDCFSSLWGRIRRVSRSGDACITDRCCIWVKRLRVTASHAKRLRHFAFEVDGREEVTRPGIISRAAV